MVDLKILFIINNFQQVLCNLCTFRFILIVVERVSLAADHF